MRDSILYQRYFQLDCGQETITKNRTSPEEKQGFGVRDSLRPGSHWRMSARTLKENHWQMSAELPM